MDQLRKRRRAFELDKQRPKHQSREPALNSRARAASSAGPCLTHVPRCDASRRRTRSSHLGSGGIPFLRAAVTRTAAKRSTSPLSASAVPRSRRSCRRAEGSSCCGTRQRVESTFKALLYMRDSGSEPSDSIRRRLPGIGALPAKFSPSLDGNFPHRTRDAGLPS